MKKAFWSAFLAATTVLSVLPLAPSVRADTVPSVGVAERLLRQARATGDTSFYDRALEAVEVSFRLEPGNLEAMRLAGWARMGRHEFAAARRIARRLVSKHPDDPLSLGLLGDALMELGEYDEAEAAYQGMLDLRPGPASYTRAAYVREIRGDPEGALELMRMALAAAGRSDGEDRTWIEVQIAHLHEAAGEREAAERSLNSALAAFPDYHDALSALAALTLADGRAEESVEFARRALEAAPHAERHLSLAGALRALGREEEALEAEARFEALALAHLEWPDNENHDLVLFYLERRNEPRRALEIARREARRRRDIHTLDRLAWALHHNGEHRRARRLAEKILRVGTRDPLVLSHAGAILAAGA